MEQLINAEVNRNVPSGDLCLSCVQRLSSDHFPDGSVICRGCLRKQMETHRKSAFGGIVREHPLETSEVDVDIGEFIRVNTQAIANIIQQGLDEHT